MPSLAVARPPVRSRLALLAVARLGDDSIKNPVFVLASKITWVSKKKYKILVLKAKHQKKKHQNA